MLADGATYLPNGWIDFAPGLGDWNWTGSFHPGGLHVLLADGSARFVSENVSSTIRSNLDYIADDQVLGEF